MNAEHQVPENAIRPIEETAKALDNFRSPTVRDRDMSKASAEGKLTQADKEEPAVMRKLVAISEANNDTQEIVRKPVSFN